MWAEPVLTPVFYYCGDIQLEIGLAGLFIKRLTDYIEKSNKISRLLVVIVLSMLGGKRL